MFSVLLLLAFQAPEGAKVFEAKCAVCHKAGSPTRAPLPAALAEMTRDRVRTALQTGLMKEQGAQLSADELHAVINFVTTKVATGPSAAASCIVAETKVKLSKLEGWSGWSASPGNTRFVDTPVDASRLKLKWAFGYPDAKVAFGQPAVVDGILFVGGEKGSVYALDAKGGCELWRFNAEAGVRTAIVVTGDFVYFGDIKANVYALSVASGELRWKTKMDEHPFARITGSPVLFDNRLYVPVSSIEELPASDPKYPCCSFRGSVAALDPATGKQVWKSYTIPDPPGAGGAVWSAPTIDANRGVLYVGTGNAYKAPAGPFTDAVIAFDLKTGTRKWHRQMTPDDHWNIACVAENKTHCPTNAGGDLDIGGSPILTTGLDGKDRLIVPQKSGIVHALDPAAEGAILWQTRVSPGGLLGGIEFGIGADRTNVYVPVSDFLSKDPSAAGGLYALNLETGAKAWQMKPPEANCKGTPGCSPAQMAPPTVTANVVFSGSMDGRLRAYESKTGRILWDFDTRRPFETVNGIPAKGGALNAVGPVLAGGMVFVQSGYGSLGGIPGNVLLAFAVD